MDFFQTDKPKNIPQTESTIYYRDESLFIRDLQPADAPLITEAEIAQGWIHQTVDKYLNRLKDRDAGRCISLVAVLSSGDIAGYINLYPHWASGPFSHGRFPEIVDFGVFEKFRCRGIGSRLMDTAEELAKQYADTVYLGVGLHSGYGSAQRMYIKRGYIPDGSGVWYQDALCTPYTACCNDDSLILYLSKSLS